MMGDAQRHSQHVHHHHLVVQRERSKSARVVPNVFAAIELCLSLAVIISAGSSTMHAISGFIWFAGISGVLLAIAYISLDILGVYDWYDYEWNGVGIFTQLCWMVFHWTSASIGSGAAKTMRDLPWASYGNVSDCYATCAFFSWLASIFYLVMAVIFTVFTVKDHRARKTAVAVRAPVTRQMDSGAQQPHLKTIHVEA